MNKAVSNKITNINFILTVLVVIIHCDCMVYANNNSVFFQGSNWINEFVSTICNVAVPSFFAISSFLFFRNFDNSKYKEKIKSRFKSLVIPYLFWSIVFLIYTIIILNIPSIAEMNNDNIKPVGNNLFSIILNNIIIDSYDGPLWYVRFLIVFAILSPLFYLVIKKLKRKNLILISIFFIVNILFNISYSNIFYWIPLYYLSAYLAINYHDKLLKFDVNILKYKKIFYIGFLIFAIFITFFKEIYILNYFYRMISPLIIYLICSSPSFEREPCKFAKYSFLIYCTHYAINVVIKRIIIIILGNNPLFILILRLITCTITVIVISLIANFIKKIFPKFYNIITGSRGVNA